MAPIAYQPNHRLVLSVLVSGITHKLLYGCNAQETSPGSGFFNLRNNDDLSYDVNPKDAADSVWEILRLRYPSSVTCSGWELQENVDGLFPALQAGVVTNVAGTGSAVALCGIASLTFKDTSGRRVILHIPESDIGYPLRYAATSTSNPFQALALSLLDNNTTDAVGYWFRSRSDNLPVVGKFLTATISKKFRKMRNLL